MYSKFKWLKTGYDMKWKSFSYAERLEFEAWMSNKMDMLNDEMMNWQPSTPKPSEDSIEQVFDIVEDVLTGELPESLQPDEDKPKKRGKK